MFEDICKSLSALCNYHIEEGSKLYTIEHICDCIKRGLNKEFPDFKCRRVIYNRNTDKSLFGIMIKPDMNESVFVQKMFAGLYDNGSDHDMDIFEPFKFDSYELEIDGRILAGDILSPIQLWAVLFNEISMMNSATPVNQLRAMIDTYIASKETHIDLSLVYTSMSTFYMASMITLHNLTSAFARYGEDVSRPLDITIESGLGEEYISAINILKQSAEWHQPVADTTGFMIVWYLNQYHWIHENRTLEYVFRDSIETESSKLVKQLILNALNQNVYVIDVDKKYYDKYIQESSSGKRRGLMWQMKRNGIKSIEEDLFEYTMRIRNIETEDDAIILMRQINSRMSILEDYLREEDIDDVDRKRWETCYSQYVELRSELSKKTLYKRKQMGLWMDYNYLADDDNTPQSQAYY